ncbi:MAG: Txe/YoeB family addiction module toxin [Proteobacteria bacterium]|nr:Txe/YoeB family addiction module toxin [Pseudomonadota bacterium]
MTPPLPPESVPRRRSGDPGGGESPSIPGPFSFRAPPPFERVVGDLAGAFSRRINIQHRLVYEVVQEQKMVKVLRMWTHYE